MAAQVVAYNVAAKAWPARSTTSAAATTPVVWIGPLSAGTPPTMGANDQRIITDPVSPGY